MKIFYSWQSDSDNNTNRGFIETALNLAVKAITNDDSLAVELVIDRDTKDVGGSPNITDTILKKIDAASIFVCDVTIINSSVDSRPTPNPNVLIELGYAMKSLGLDRIIMVQNQLYGDRYSLPFDLRQNRVLGYSIHPSDPEKAPARKVLAKQIEEVIRLIMPKILSSAPAPVNVLSEIKRLLSNPSEKIQLNDFVSEQGNLAFEAIESSNFFDYQERPPDATKFVGRVTTVEKACKDLEQIFVMGGAWADIEQFRSFSSILLRFVAVPESSDYIVIWKELARYPALRLFYAAGIAAIVRGNYVVIKQLLFDLKHYEKYQTPEWKSVVEHLNTGAVFTHNHGRLLPGRDRHHFPASDYLESSLRDYFRNEVPNDALFSQIFDRFEYYVSIAYAAITSLKGFTNWVPIGTFGWRRQPDILKIVEREIENEGTQWPLLKIGCFSSLEELLETKRKTDEFVGQARDRLW